MLLQGNEGVRQITTYAREHETEFVEMVANKSQAEISKSQRDNKRELDQSQKRMEKLDTIIQKLYEDNAFIAFPYYQSRHGRFRPDAPLLQIAMPAGSS